MTPATRELFRIALLRILEANETRYGLSATAVAMHVGVYGFRGVSEDTILAELRYLFDKGFVATPVKELSPENKTWQITANGRDWLATNG